MAMDNTRKKSRLKPKALTRKEEEILRAVSELHYVTRKGIARLLYPPGSFTHAGEDLRRLSGGADLQKSYLCKLSLVANAPGNFELTYALSRRGAALLRELGCHTDWWCSPRTASRYGGYSNLVHPISLGKFLIALRAFVRAFPEYHLLEIRTCYDLERQPPQLPFVEEGRKGASSVIPDAWVHIELPDTRRSALWIEIDCGTESKARFQSLVLDRINFVRDGGYEKYFGTPSLLYCYLAVGATTDYRLARLSAMRRWIAEVLDKQKLDDWADVFRLSTIDECIFDTHMHYTDPVWTSAASSTLVSLFPPYRNRRKMMALSLLQTVTSKVKEMLRNIQQEAPESNKTSPTLALPKPPAPGHKEVPVIHISAKTASSNGVAPNGQANGTQHPARYPDENTLLTVLGTDSTTGEAVTISLKERYMGLYVIGATGTGKTTLDLS